MPRLFVALEIGSKAQRRIADEQERLAETMRGAALRWTKYEQLHITLVFIGQVSDEHAAAIVEAMRDPLPHPAVSICVGRARCVSAAWRAACPLDRGDIRRGTGDPCSGTRGGTS